MRPTYGRSFTRARCWRLNFLSFQIDRLLQVGANILTPIPVGARRQTGTVVDYAHYVYNLVSLAISVWLPFFCAACQNSFKLGFRGSNALLDFARLKGNPRQIRRF